MDDHPLLRNNFFNCVKTSPGSLSESSVKEA